VKALPRWPLYLIALPAAVAVWSGWVGIGQLSGFGVIRPLPGIWDAARINTAITLPIGVEAYGAYAMGAWLSPGVPQSARKFAKWSAIGALTLGMLGQVAYHLLSAAHASRAPWPVVVLVSSLPVVVLGFGAALSHLLRGEHEAPQTVPEVSPESAPELLLVSASVSAVYPHPEVHPRAHPGVRHEFGLSPLLSEPLRPGELILRTCTPLSWRRAKCPRSGASAPTSTSASRKRSRYRLS
jgi:hypothetical protein